MRPHGRAAVSRRHPQALAICDRCGTRYNHNDLGWQYDWQGPRLQNKRILVCRSCQDKPFEQARTIILPPDPMPILNPRLEFYVSDDNPIQTLGSDANPLGGIGANIGNLTGGSGNHLNQAFIGTTNKTLATSAKREQSYVDLNNWIGKYWGANVALTPIPAELSTAVYPTYAIGTVTLYAPTDAPFLASGATTLEFQGWDGSDWQTLYSGSTVGGNGEILTFSPVSTTRYYGHRVAINGDGTAVAVAYLKLEAVSEGVLAAAPANAPGANPQISVNATSYVSTGDEIYRRGNLSIPLSIGVYDVTGIPIISDVSIPIGSNAFASTGLTINTDRGFIAPTAGYARNVSAITFARAGNLTMSAESAAFTRSGGVVFPAFSNHPFVAGHWSISNMGLTYGQSDAAGTSLGAIVRETISGNNHSYIYRNLTLSSGTNYTFRTFAKYTGVLDCITLSLTTAATNNNFFTVVYDINNQSVGETAVGSSSGTIVSTSLEDVGDGWCICTVTGSVNVTGVSMRIGSCLSPTGNTFDAKGNVDYNLATRSNIFGLWGCCLFA